jgi:chromosome segregation ATPase
MNEEERRQEILKAEATIQQLAKEMAHASGVASQAGAARVALDAARLDVIKSVDELNEAISTQKTTNTEAMAALNQAKKSLEDAISTLTDVGVHIDRIEIHINEAVNEARATAKIVESIPNRLSTALSQELSQADKSIEKRHTALMQISENNSNKLKDISQSIDDNHKNVSATLNNKISQIETDINEGVNEIRATAKMIESTPNRLSAALSRELSQADKSIVQRHTALMQILENDSNNLQEISQSIDSNHRNISGALDSKFSQVDTAIEEKHSASMQVLENNSNELKDISKSIDSNHRNISELLNSLTRWWVISAALTLLGVWISAIILLIRG